MKDIRKSSDPVACIYILTFAFSSILRNVGNKLSAYSACDGRIVFFVVKFCFSVWTRSREKQLNILSSVARIVCFVGVLTL